METNPTYNQLRAVFDAVLTNETIDPNTPWQPPTPLIDWAIAYGDDTDPDQWLAQPLIPTQGSVALFAKGGTGKSLLALWIAAGLATGTGITHELEPVPVLYLDYEMTIRDVVSRLEEMGHDNPTNLAHLHYASLPSLAPLDTLEGGRALVDMATHLNTALVVIDTFGRAVTGQEDKADTVRDWFRWTGQLLKAAGIAFLRVDHAGKDTTRGQRGTSAKNDDVDLVWEMTDQGHGQYLLKATKRRVSWVEERVVLTQTNINGVLAYQWTGANVGYLAGTKEVAELLDELGCPIDISRRKALAELRSAGEGRDNNVVADALRWRREQANTGFQYHPGTTYQVLGKTRPNTNTKPQQIPPEDQSIPPTRPNPPEGDTHRRCVPLVDGGPTQTNPFD